MDYMMLVSWQYCNFPGYNFPVLNFQAYKFPGQSFSGLEFIRFEFIRPLKYQFQKKKVQNFTGIIMFKSEKINELDNKPPVSKLENSKPKFL